MYILKKIRLKKTNLNNVRQLTQNVLDQLTGAEQPKMYFNPEGELTEVLQKLP